jgi:hypothetical protein
MLTKREYRYGCKIRLGDIDDQALIRESSDVRAELTALEGLQDALVYPD